jgi:hypothetical protein
MRFMRWITVAALAVIAVPAVLHWRGQPGSPSFVGLVGDTRSTNVVDRQPTPLYEAPMVLESTTTLPKKSSELTRAPEASHSRLGQVEPARASQRAPRLSGRVVSSTGVPQAEAIVSVQVFEMDESSMSTEVRTEADGRFSIRLADDQFRDCEIHARRGEHGPLKVGVRFLRSRIDPSLDVGDIAFPSEAFMTVHVVDTAGWPIANANVGGWGADKNGDCEIGPEWRIGHEVRVDAPGYWSVSLTLPEPFVDRQDVQLSPCNRLTFHFSGMQPEMAELLSVSIRDTGRPLCADSEPHSLNPKGNCVLEGRQAGTGSFGGGQEGTIFKPDESGVLLLEGLDPSATIEFSVQGPLRTSVHEATLAPLGSAGRRRVDIPLTGRAHELVVSVSDAKGKPLFGAEVQVSALSGSETKSTVADGKSRFPLLFASQVDLEVRLVGYAKAARRSVPLDRRVEYAEFRLARGRRLTVEVVDTKSRPVAGGSVSAVSPETGLRWESWSSRTGKYELDELPDEGKLQIRLEQGGRSYAQLHDPNVPLMRFEVPVQGRVALKWKLPTGSAESEPQIVLQCTEDNTRIVWGPVADETEGEWTAEAVEPGEYNAMVLRQGKGDDWIHVVPAKRITVSAERTVTVMMGP